MCSSVWSWLSPVFSVKFGCHLHPLQSTLKKTLHSKVFFEKWNDIKKPKKNLRKESWYKWYNQMGQVGTSWSRGTSGTRRGGSSDLSGTSGGVQVGQGQACHKGSVHLNHSTCPKCDYKAVEFFGARDNGTGTTYWRLQTKL